MAIGAGTRRVDAKESDQKTDAVIAPPKVLRAVASVFMALALVFGLAVAPAAADELPESPHTPGNSASERPGASSGGDDVRQREYWINDYKIPQLWRETTGRGVTVAVIDTGVDGTHPDLEGNVLKGYDASGVGSADGWQGLGVEPMHGTEVSSLIAGHGHDTPGLAPIAGQPGKPAGVIGLAPEAKILPISLNMGGAGGKSIDEQLPDAVRYAVDNGAQIINLSIGSNKANWPAGWDDAFKYAEEKGVLVVASAGNRGSGITEVGAPATIPGVLTVGSVDRNRQESWSSSSQGISIAAAAPGVDMIAAAPGNKYMLWSGSSASAPLVSALAALIKARYPDLQAPQIIQRIITSADDAGIPGRDTLYGFGIINPTKALDEGTASNTTQNPLGSITNWIAIHRKQQVNAPDANDLQPVHEDGESIPLAQAPTPKAPPEGTSYVPPIIMGALTLWLIIITLWAIHRLHKLHRHIRRPHVRGESEGTS